MRRNRPAVFKGRHFEAEIIVVCVRWCLRFDRALELHPHFHLAHWHRGWAAAELREFDQAISSIRIAADVSGSGAQPVAALAQVHAASGRTREAKSILRELSGAAGSQYSSPYDLAMVHVSMRYDKRALSLLERAARDRVPALIRLAINPTISAPRNIQFGLS